MGETVDNITSFAWADSHDVVVTVQLRGDSEILVLQIPAIRLATIIEDAADRLDYEHTLR